MMGEVLSMVANAIVSSLLMYCRLFVSPSYNLLLVNRLEAVFLSPTHAWLAYTWHFAYALTDKN
jgi:hypothetical protein